MKSVIQLGLVIILITLIVGPGFMTKSSSVGNNSFNSNIAKAASATEANDMYVFWFSNKTGNDEVMFSSSTDGGKTFNSKVNLINNTSPSDPREVGVSTGNDNIVIGWTERNASGNESLNDIVQNNGVTAGIILLRSTNETRDTVE
jgi:uncharacterized protein (UPF0333 family)